MRLSQSGRPKGKPKSKNRVNGTPNRVTVEFREAALANVAPRPATPTPGRREIPLSLANIWRLLEKTRGKALFAGLDQTFADVRQKENFFAQLSNPITRSTASRIRSTVGR